MTEVNDGKFPLDSPRQQSKSRRRSRARSQPFSTRLSVVPNRLKQVINKVAKATGAEFAALFDQHMIPIAQNAQGRVQDELVKQATLLS